MIKNKSCDIIVAVEDGYMRCPYCRYKLGRVFPQTSASDLPLYCRRCKTEMIVNINQGQCHMSQGR